MRLVEHLMEQSINGVYMDTYVNFHDEKKLIDTIYHVGIKVALGWDCW